MSAAAKWTRGHIRGMAALAVLCTLASTLAQAQIPISSIEEFREIANRSDYSLLRNLLVNFGPVC